MARSVFTPARPHYTNLDERLRAHPFRIPDKELTVETPAGRMAGPAWPEPMISMPQLPGNQVPKPDTTRLMTRNQRKML